MKKMIVSGIISAVMLSPAFAANKAEPAAPAPAASAPAVTLESLVKNWPAVLAVFDGQKLTKAELIAELNKQIPGGQLPPGMNEQMMNSFAPELIKGMVIQKLLLSAMQKAGIVPSAALVKAALEKQIKGASQEELAFLNQMLAQQKKTLDQFITEQSQNPVAQQMAALQLFMDKYVVAGVKVTEADALKYYESNKKQFVQPADAPGSMRASHILVKLDPKASEDVKKAALAKVNKIAAELKQNPKNFEALAKVNSECPSGQNGGSLGVFNKGQMVPEFEKAVLELKDGEISGVITTQFGYHIIRRDPAAPEKVLPFAQVKDQLIGYLANMEKQKAMKAYTDNLLKKANFKILLPAAAGK